MSTNQPQYPIAGHPDRAYRLGLARTLTARTLFASTSAAQHPTPAPTNRARRDQPLGQYTRIGVTTCTLWLALSGQPTAPTDVFRALWTPGGLTDDEMTFICLGDLRHTGRRYRNVNTDGNARKAEMQRLNRYIRSNPQKCTLSDCTICRTRAGR